MRFFLYSHDGMGLGHVRRQVAIAAALHEAAPRSQIILATSVDEVCSLGLPPHVDTLKLPGLRKVANGQYCSRRLSISKTQMRELRSRVLRETIGAFRPDVILLDKHPLGVGGEMRSALEVAKASQARIVLGLRDILDEPSTVLSEWGREGVWNYLKTHFDQVLIYGIRSVFDPIKKYGFPESIAARSKYCGYVLNKSSDSPDLADLEGLERFDNDSRPTVLCTAGGGEDGFLLLKTFLDASKVAPWKSIAITGPMIPVHELATLRRMAADTAIFVKPFVPCLGTFLEKADAVVCMGGYNTLLEALSRGLPIVCIPRVSPRTEQLMRASAFQKFGLVRRILPTDLSRQSLQGEIAKALTARRAKIIEQAMSVLDFDGASAAARYLLRLARGRKQPKESKQGIALTLLGPGIVSSPVEWRS